MARRIDLAVLQRNAQSATAGDWHTNTGDPSSVMCGEFLLCDAQPGAPNGGSYERHRALAEANAAHIAGCDPTTVLALIDAVNAAQATEAALADLLDDTQHKSHADCEEGPCPVRDARQALVDLRRALAPLGGRGEG